jgi:hypothetical protein
MLIIPIKDGENIDRALKRFKRKFDRTGTMRQLRARQAYNISAGCYFWAWAINFKNKTLQNTTL